MGKSSETLEGLSSRQQREREFYQQYASRSQPDEINFKPVLGEEQRPWNSYWALYGEAAARCQQGTERLLDVGCGPGISAVMLARRGFKVSAFDIAPNNIEAATKLATRYGEEDSIEFSVQTAEQLTYPDDYFDVIIGVDILHHIEIEASIRECMRILKPGGLAIFREHIEVPLLDRVRNTALVRWLVPNTPSLDQHITEDERKLNKQDMATIRKQVDDLTVRRFGVLARGAHRISDRLDMFLQKLDWRLTRLMPWIGCMGGDVVLSFSKSKKDS